MFSEKNILHYRQGNVELIFEDLNLIGLPSYIVDYMRCLLIARGANKAYTIRRELVNYKKVRMAKGELSLTTLRFSITWCTNTRTSQTISVVSFRCSTPSTGKSMNLEGRTTRLYIRSLQS